MKIALLGYGTVGRSLHDLLEKRDLGIEVKRILRRKADPADPRITDRIEDILEDGEIECVAEALSGSEPAGEYLKMLMKSGKHVVSANKAAIANDFEGLLRLAEKNNVFFQFEASSGGTIPWIENIKDISSADEIISMKGILNGTCNFIIDKMEREGFDFEQALSIAQSLGYAEADPTADIGGQDTYNKALISCSLGYRGFVKKDFPVLGIEKLSPDGLWELYKEEKTVRFMMISRRLGERYAVGVVPTVVRKDSIEANVRENFNCASITGATTGELKFYGQGSGGYPTADAMVRDLVRIRDRVAENDIPYRKLIYDDSLLWGVGHFPGEKKRGKLSELIKEALEKDIFMAFECEEDNTKNA